MIYTYKMNFDLFGHQIFSIARNTIVLQLIITTDLISAHKEKTTESVAPLMSMLTSR